MNLLFNCASSFLTLLLYSILASNSRINKSFMSEVLPFCEAINIAKHVELIRPAPLSRLALNKTNTIYWIPQSFVILTASWSQTKLVYRTFFSKCFSRFDKLSMSGPYVYIAFRMSSDFSGSTSRPLFASLNSIKLNYSRSIT